MDIKDCKIGTRVVCISDEDTVLKLSEAYQRIKSVNI